MCGFDYDTISGEYLGEVCSVSGSPTDYYICPSGASCALASPPPSANDTGIKKLISDIVSFFNKIIDFFKKK